MIQSLGDLIDIGLWVVARRDSALAKRSLTLRVPSFKQWNETKPQFQGSWIIQALVAMMRFKNATLRPSGDGTAQPWMSPNERYWPSR